MRQVSWVYLLLAAGVALSGCAGEPEELSATGGEASAAESPAMPENFMRDIHHGQSFDVVGNAVGRCQAMPWCFDYAVVIPDGIDLVRVDVGLEWGLPASDYDLYLQHGDQVLDSDAVHMAATSASVTYDAPPGEYVVWVVPYAVAMDDAVLTVTFSEA